MLLHHVFLTVGIPHVLKVSRLLDPLDKADCWPEIKEVYAVLCARVGLREQAEASTPNSVADRGNFQRHLSLSGVVENSPFEGGFRVFGQS